MKRKNKALNFEIDKLTNSIENAVSGDSFVTEVSLLTKEDLKFITKKNGWQFDWKAETKYPNREVYKLTIVENRHIIQGLASFEMRETHIYMHLLESAPFNTGKNKVYLGVAGNLVALGCLLSFQRGGGGYLSFLSKTKLVEHYEKTLGAVHYGGRIMAIEHNAAKILVNKYFKQ